MIIQWNWNVHFLLTATVAIDDESWVNQTRHM